MCYFFFSSRRRHTRFDCDWSSDVCTSDLERRPIPDRSCGSLPPLLLGHTEIGEGEQVRAGGEDELVEIRRPLAAQRRDGLAKLERVPDRVTEWLVHVGEHARHLAAGMTAELEHQL